MKGYYSEYLPNIGGRLHVESNDVSIVVSAKGLDGRRKGTTIHKQDIEEILEGLSTDWGKFVNISKDSGSTQIDGSIGNTILFDKSSSIEGITLWDDCCLISTDKQLETIKQELMYAARRGDEVKSVLFKAIEEEPEVITEDSVPEEEQVKEETEEEAPRINSSSVFFDDDRVNGSVEEEEPDLFDFPEDTADDVQPFEKEDLPEPEANNPEPEANPEPDEPTPNIMDLVSALETRAEDVEDNDNFIRYRDMFTTLHYNRAIPYYGKAKAVLLLCVAQLVGTNTIKTTKVAISKELAKTYTMFWNRYADSSAPRKFSSYETAFLSMGAESFWRLVPNETHDSSQPFISNINDCKFAVMDKHLYDLLRAEKYRLALMTAVIDKYL